MLLTIVVFILTLGVLVISHELGHFFTARKFGIRVLEFGFGLPPRAWSKKVGQMIVSLNWLPIGGFVRLLGEDEEDPKLRYDKASFAAQPAWQRLIVVMSGVTINLVFAWALFYVVLVAQDWKIFYPFVNSPTNITEVQPGYPAEAAGLQPGEKIVAIDGQPIQSTDQVISYIRSKANTPVNLELTDNDGNNDHQLTVTPRLEDGIGKIGVAFGAFPFKYYRTFGERLFSGISYSGDVIKYTVLGLGKLGQQLSARDFQQASQSVAGPVGLAVITNNIISNGWQASLIYVWFVAILSLTLSVMNSLPFPALDGGRAVFLIYEMVLRRKPNPTFERWVHTVGMAILLTAMVIITFSDLAKLNLF